MHNAVNRSGEVVRFQNGQTFVAARLRRSLDWPLRGEVVWAFIAGPIMARGKTNKKNRPKRRKRSAQSENQHDILKAAWLDQEGMHALLPGTPPDQQMLERMTRIYQEQIRKSPLWDEMVREFGPEKAEELLRQCRAELG